MSNYSLKEQQEMQILAAKLAQEARNKDRARDHLLAIQVYLARMPLPEKKRAS